jgi:hypothetical protein
MTEEQKMEEGKRMFSIFAARMFEQRVLKVRVSFCSAETLLIVSLISFSRSHFPSLQPRSADAHSI